MGHSPRRSIAKADEHRKADAPLVDRLMTVREAAEYLHVSVSWLYDSMIPFVPIFDGPRGRRYKRPELDAYVEARSTHTLLGRSK